MKSIKVCFMCYFFLSFNVFAWDLLPGAAVDVADGWVIGTAANGAGGNKIYRWDNGSARGFVQVPGSALRIGGNYSNPWIINSLGKAYQWSGKAFINHNLPVPVGQTSIQATDIADGWAISNIPTPGGFTIYQWTGAQWILKPGGAVRIGGTRSTPWVVNDLNEIFVWKGGSFKVVPGEAVDVGDGWVLGTSDVFGERPIYRWNGTDFVLVPGLASRIGGSGGTPWIVQSGNAILRW